MSDGIRYAVGVRTVNDSNGNSRRGWLVYRSDGVLLGFVDGYAGDHALYQMFPNAVITLASLQVTPAEFHSAKYGPQAWVADRMGQI